MRRPDLQSESATSQTRLRLALRIGAVVWFLLLLAGFFAPGGWTWGMPGPIGHMENYVISLWLVALVAAPIVASRNPGVHSGTLFVYLLGIAAILVSTVRGEPPKLISDAPPWIAAFLTVGLLIWAHPERARLLRPD